MRTFSPPAYGPIPTRGDDAVYSGPRFLLYSHDGFGLGHFRRNVVLATTLVDMCPGASVLLACGADGLDSFSLPPGVDLLRLPGLRKLENGRYAGRRLSAEASQLRPLRAGLLASAVQHFRPHVLLADKHPVGIDEELLPALRLLQRYGGHAALGLRDVLDDPHEAVDEWRSAGLGARVADFHELVLVYGSRDVLDPIYPGLLPPGIEARVRFCGYVVNRLPMSGSVPLDLPPINHGRPLVLASVGGGEDGLPVLDAFIEASLGTPWPAAVVAGPQMDAGRWAELERRAAEAGVFAYRAVHQVQRWFPHAGALVCMGGYNSVLEAVSSGTPTICVPRTLPRREQLIRARAFAARGLLQVVEPEALTSRSLALAIQGGLGTPRAVMAQRAAAALDLDGARRAAALLLGLALAAPVPARHAAEVAAG
jgi:predicted glycosyltransferase